MVYASRYSICFITSTKGITKGNAQGWYALVFSFFQRVFWTSPVPRGLQSFASSGVAEDVWSTIARTSLLSKGICSFWFKITTIITHLQVSDPTPPPDYWAPKGTQPFNKPVISLQLLIAGVQGTWC